MNNLKIKSLSVMILACSLAACGGGSSSSKAKQDILTGETSLNKVVFNAIPDGSNELWVSNGKDAGTVVLNEDVTYDKALGQDVLNKRIFFIASESNGDNNAWVSDGTAANTVAIVDEATQLPIEHGTSTLGEHQRPYVLAGGKVYFMGDNQKVYEVNGNEAKAVADLSDLSSGLAHSSGTRRIEHAGTIATDGTTLFFNIGFRPGSSLRLQGLEKVGIASVGPSYEYVLHRLNTTLATAHKLEALETTTSNSMIKTMAVAPQSVAVEGDLNHVFAMGGKTYFAMEDAIYSMSDELSSIALVEDSDDLNTAKTAILDDGTVMVYEQYSPWDIYELSQTGLTNLNISSTSMKGFSKSNLQRSPNLVFAGKDKLYFKYNSSNAMRLAAVESAVSTFSLAAVDKTGDVNLVEYGTKITALTSDQRIIKSIGSSNDQTKAMKFAKGIVFEVDSEQAGKELWAINYATGKIDLLEDLNSTSADDADPIVLGLLGDSNKVIFSADSGTSTGSAGVTDTGTGRELWVSAGVAGDPTLVKDIADGSDDGVGVVSNLMVAH